MFRLAIYTGWSSTKAALLKRERMPASYRTAGEAAAAGVAYLQAHAQAIGFEIEPPGLEAANDAASHGRTVYRAQAARKARQRRKETEARQ